MARQWLWALAALLVPLAAGSALAPGHTYTYQYRTTSTTSPPGSGARATGLRIACRLAVHVHPSAG